MNTNRLRKTWGNSSVRVDVLGQGQGDEAAGYLTKDLIHGAAMEVARPDARSAVLVGAPRSSCGSGPSMGTPGPRNGDRSTPRSPAVGTVSAERSACGNSSDSGSVPTTSSLTTRARLTSWKTSTPTRRPVVVRARGDTPGVPGGRGRRHRGRPRLPGRPLGRAHVTGAAEMRVWDRERAGLAGRWQKPHRQEAARPRPVTPDQRREVRTVATSRWWLSDSSR